MIKSPLISIILPLYNSEKYIKETLASVLNQSYRNWELILVDDASSDKCVAMVQKYVEEDKRIVLLKNSHNLGAAQSRNVGITQAKGDYIAFLDSDDLWFPKKLEIQLAYMQKHHVSLCYSSYDVIDEEGQLKSQFMAPKTLTYNEMLKSSRMGTLTLLYDVKSLGKHYFKDVGHEDYVWKLNLLKHVEYAGGIEEPLASYRLVSHSLSSNKLRAAVWQWKIYREIEKLSFVKSIYYFVQYAFYGVFKYR